MNINTKNYNKTAKKAFGTHIYYNLLRTYIMYALFHSLSHVKSCTSVANYYFVLLEATNSTQYTQKKFLFSTVEIKNVSFLTLKHEFKT